MKQNELKSKKFIPKAVLKKYSEIVRYYGGKIRLLGKREDAEYYIFELEDNPEAEVETGFPLIVEYKPNLDIASKIIGFEALRIADLFYFKN